MGFGIRCAVPFTKFIASSKKIGPWSLSGLEPTTSRSESRDTYVLVCLFCVESVAGSMEMSVSPATIEATGAGHVRPPARRRKLRRVVGSAAAAHEALLCSAN